MKILDININEQSKALYRRDEMAASARRSFSEGGNVWRELGEKGKEQVLTEKQILELSELIVKIENHYGFPCDIEWAFEDGEFYITQSRPITTLSAVPEKIQSVNIFKKGYTRDTTMTVQESWGRAFQRYAYEKWGWKNPHTPTVIDEFYKGSVAIWENEQGVKWFVDKILEENIHRPERYWNEMEVWQKQVDEIRKFWGQKYFNTAKELAEFVKKVDESILGYVFYYYSAMDDRTPEKIHSHALGIRKKDEFFSSCSTFVRNSLIHLYPDREGLETAILISEIENPPDIETLRERQNNFLILDGDVIVRDSVKHYVAGLENAKIISDEVPVTNEVIGNIGFKGKAFGRVFLLYTRGQMNSIPDGAILVSPMTTPDFLPVMERAAAFITDEGGITCHAAIVARELKKPCIIGTKIATQVLHDGDLVEVDADNGVVRVIEKASKT